MSVADEEAAWQSTKDAMMLLIRELGTGAAYQLEDLRAGDLGQTLREIAMGVPEERSIANLQKGLNSLEVSTQMYQVVRKGRDEARALIAQADEALQRDDAEEAIRKYILSAELFKSIATDVEIADVLVDRAGARPRPSWEFEFEFFLGPGDTSLGAHLFGDLESLDLPSKEACRQLFRAAINVAGRAVAAIIHDDDKDPTERELDDVDRWRIYPALDVIRVSLENLPDSDAALRTVCQFYFEWEWRNGWLWSEHPADQVNPFTKKFAYSAGYLDGREVREAIDSVTRLTDPPILLREMHKDIQELLARRPPSRADLASALEAEFGLLWSSVDDFVKEPMIEGESLLARIPDTGPSRLRPGDRPVFEGVRVHMRFPEEATSRCTCIGDVRQQEE